jgi:DNA-binding beta-propeller fold protein YncE
MNALRRLFLLLSLVALASCGGGGGSGTVPNSTAIIGVALDSYVNPTKLYVTNADNQTLQVVDLATNAVTTLAGLTNTAGTADGTGSVARFYEPFGIALSGTDFYVADTNNHTLRKLTTAGVVSTVAGTAGTYGSVDGTGTAANFNTPKSLVGDGGTNLYVADSFNHIIRKVVISTGVVSTIAGYGGTTGTADGAGSAAKFNEPFGITYDATGTNLYVTDTVNQLIRQVTPGGVVTTWAGTVSTRGTTDAIGTTAKFNFPAGIVNDGTNLYVADSENHVIRKIVIASKVVTTLAGTAGTAGAADGSGAAARFNRPIGLTIDSAGNLYVVDQNYSKIRKVTTAGVVTTLSATF